MARINGLQAATLVLAMTAAGCAVGRSAGSEDATLLGTDDPRLRPALIAGARTLFGTHTYAPIRVDGVFVNGQRHEFLTAEVKDLAAVVPVLSWTRPPSCESSPPRTVMNPAPPPSDPAVTGRGASPPPASAPPPEVQTTVPREGGARCETPVAVTYSFPAVRVDSDTAYVEVRARNYSQFTACVVLVGTWPNNWTALRDGGSKRRRCGR